MSKRQTASASSGPRRPVVISSATCSAQAAPGPQLGGTGIDGEPAPSESAQRLQHREPWRVAGVPDDEGTLHQVGQCGGVPADRANRSLVDRAREHGEPLEQGALVVVQQTVRPLDHVAQRPVPRRRGPPATAQDVEGLLQGAEQPGKAQRQRAGGGQLERERQPVQASAELRDESLLARFVEHGRCGGPDPVGQQLGGRRRRKRLDADHVLPVDVQRFPAGEQQVHRRRTRCDRLDETGHLVGDVLAVVEHDQLVTHGEDLDDPVGERGSCGIGEGQGSRDRWLHLRRPAVAQLDEEHAVVVPVGHRRGDMGGQARLADSAGPAQRHDATAIEQLGGTGQVSSPADERADRHHGGGGRLPGRLPAYLGGHLLAQHLLLQHPQLR